MTLPAANISRERFLALLSEFLHAATVNLRLHGEVLPVALLVRGQEVAAVPLQADDAAQREKIREEIFLLVEENPPEAAFFISDIWTLPAGEYERTGLRPAAHPGRGEAVAISGAMPGFSACAKIRYETLPDGSFAFGDVEVGGAAAHGTEERFWIDGLFPPANDKGALN